MSLILQRPTPRWREPFHVALSSRMWQAYHESRQRGAPSRFEMAPTIGLDTRPLSPPGAPPEAQHTKGRPPPRRREPQGCSTSSPGQPNTNPTGIRHRFVATDLIADLGEEGVPAAALAAARAGGRGFGGALLLATRNSSWPVEPDADEDDASLAVGRSRLPALLGLSPPPPPPPPPLGIAFASPPGATTNTSLAATVGAGGGAGGAGGGAGGADTTAADAQARAFASLHGVTRREERPGVRFAEEHLFPTVQGAVGKHDVEHGAGRDASLEPDESAEEVRHT